MGRNEIKVLVGAVLFGVLVAMASLRGCPAEALENPASPAGTGTASGSAPSVTPVDLKNRLLDIGDLRAVHHEVYRAVGEREWEARVKPAFLADITRAAARTYGTPIPDADQVLEWARNNPHQARSYLERHTVPEPRP